MCTITPPDATASGSALPRPASIRLSTLVLPPGPIAPWALPASPAQRDVAEIVRTALPAARSLAEFRGSLLRAGYGFAMGRLDPGVVHPAGGPHIRLGILGLRTEFWLRFHRWGEDIAAVPWGTAALPRFWQALTRSALCREQVDTPV